MVDLFSELDEFEHNCWQELQKAVHQKRHPWRLAVLSNAVADKVQTRTVVLRSVNAAVKNFRFYTDLRSRKMAAVIKQQVLSWLFYHPQKQLQLTAYTLPTILPTEETTQIWQQLPLHSRKAYATVAAPGSITEIPEDGLPSQFNLKHSEEMINNFAVVDCQALHLEVLQLSRQGQRRAQFIRQPDNSWKANWLIP